MADETTYDSEMNQPAHRPGMEGVVNRADARDQSGSRTGERPTVGAGKVDPFSVQGNGAPKGTAPPGDAPAAAGGEPASGLKSGIGGRQREAAIMDATDKAVTG